MVPLETILLIEDNPADVILVGEAMRTHGVSRPLHVLQDGASALVFIRGCDLGVPTPSLVLLDLNLPKHDGFEVLSVLRRQRAFSRIPVIVVSSSQNPDDERAALALGATRYFTKCADLDGFLELGRVIRELLMTTRHGRAGSLR